jgi:low affinity Fe/Cu permease
MFLVAVVLLVVWVISGPLFHINTGTTIVTFLVVFLIQNTRTVLRRRRVAADVITMPSSCQVWSTIEIAG